MKIQLVLISSIAASFVMFGMYLFFFSTETEYTTPPATAYIDGATPPSPVLHPINP